jgi:hypothetical protein
MTLLDWIKTLWPAAVVLVTLAVRLEVGQALNKQRLRSIEKEIENAEKSAEKANEAVHARLSRHETETNKYLGEIRNDIKTLLSRH